MKRISLGILFVFLCVSVCKAGNVETLGIGSKATALGGAYSAYADDPYAVYYNPAGLVQMKVPLISAGILVAKGEGDYDNFTVRTNGTVILGPKDHTSRYDLKYVPQFGGAYPIGENVVLGLASYIPFGGEINWSDNPAKNPGAYDSYHSAYIRKVITPAVAYKVSDKLSVGAGISLGQTWMRQDKFLWGTMTKLKFDMTDDLNYSFNAGVMYHPNNELDLGLTYRGRAKTTCEGNVEVNGVDTGIDGKCRFDAPAQIQAGLKYNTPHNITVEWDLVWTGWGIADDQVTKFSPSPLLGVLTESRVPRNWNNTLAIKVGSEWHVNDMWALRAGYFYDPCPIPDKTFDFAWYDSDREIFSLGAGMHKANWTVDTVIQYVDYKHGVKRAIGGESVNINHSFSDNNPATDERVSVEPSGNIWTVGTTVSYQF